MADLEINPSMSLADLEEILPSPSAKDDLSNKLQIVVKPAPEMLVDVWAAIVAGTLCRRSETEVTYTDSREGLRVGTLFENSLVGLACASLAGSVRSRAGATLDLAVLRRRLMLANKGLVSPDSDVAQALIEFDNDYPVSPLLKSNDGSEVPLQLRRKLLETVILQFRQVLDLGALRRRAGPVRQGKAGDLGRFLAELHENGFQHGRREGENKFKGTRFLRIRVHEVADFNELFERCGPFKQLQKYVARTFSGNDPVKLFEASVSDFGPGIVDGFQASPSGFGPNVDRRQLLESLIYERLSSKANDPSAGLGIPKALEAAESMQAFVSLRTAEFWMAASFLPDNPDARLVHLGNKDFRPVAGTHWQILWPHY